MTTPLDRELDFEVFPPVSTDAWRAQIEHDLRGAAFDDRLVWHSLNGFDVQPFYRAEDLAALAPINPLAVRTGQLQIRENIEVADVAEANRLAHLALAGGADSLGIVLRIRADAVMDQVLHGVSVQSQDDTRRLFDGLDLMATALHLDAGEASLPLLAMVINEAERQDLDLATLRGTVGFDPLATLARRGQLGLQAVFTRMAHVIETHDMALSGFRLLAVDARPFHEAGAAAAQTLACALSSLTEQWGNLTEHGLAPGRLAQTLHVVMPIGTSYFVEIAALRALRQLTALVFEAFGVDPQTPLMVQAETSRWSETLYDPYTNLLRATSESAAAMLGGADVLAVRPFDARSAAPNDRSVHLARNIPLLLQHEAHLLRVDDPAAGSYYIEVLTDELSHAAWAMFQEVEARGGLTAALRDGFVQAQIGQTRERREREIGTRKRVFIGTSQFPNEHETRREAVETLSQGTALVDNAYDDFFAFDAPIAAYQNLLRRGASLGDLVRLSASGELVRIVPMSPTHGADSFETIRLATEHYAADTGRMPTTLLLLHGNPVWRSARAAFARNVFGTAGLHVEERDFPSDGEQPGADLVVLCSSDAEYPDFTAAVRPQIDDKTPLLVAGNPRDLPEDALRAAGVDDFLFRGMDLPAFLTDLQHRLGIA